MSWQMDSTSQAWKYSLKYFTFWFTSQRKTLSSIQLHLISRLTNQTQTIFTCFWCKGYRMLSRTSASISLLRRWQIGSRRQMRKHSKKKLLTTWYWSIAFVKRIWTILRNDLFMTIITIKLWSLINRSVS